VRAFFLFSLSLSLSLSLICPMAKKKNHTAQNQSKKAHKNGIHRPKRHKYISLKGRDPKFVRNLNYAKAAQRARDLGGDDEEKGEE